MKKLSLLALVGLILTGGSAAFAAPAKPKALSVESALYYFDRLPARHFTPFGKGPRRALLKRRGAIYDARYRFIEIPMAGISASQNIHKLQITVFRDAGVDVVAVSRIVWQQTQVRGELTFYREFKMGGKWELVDDTRTLFPYQLSTVEHSDSKTPVFVNAYLPRRGNVIQFGVPETDAIVAEVVWNRGRFERRS